VTSAPLEIDFAATSVATSWHAETPGSSWIEVLVRGTTTGNHDADGIQVAADEPAGTGWCTIPRPHTIPDSAAVRSVYARDQLEHAWLGRAGGIVYVIHPAHAALPAAPAEANW